MSEEAEKVRLTVDLRKTEYVVVTRVGIRGNHDTFAYENMNFNSTNQFKYPGTLVTQINNTSMGLKNTLSAENVYNLILHRLLTSKLLFYNTKIRIY